MRSIILSIMNSNFLIWTGDIKTMMAVGDHMTNTRGTRLLAKISSTLQAVTNTEGNQITSPTPGGVSNHVHLLVDPGEDSESLSNVKIRLSKSRPRSAQEGDKIIPFFSISPYDAMCYNSTPTSEIAHSSLLNFKLLLLFFYCLLCKFDTVGNVF